MMRRLARLESPQLVWPALAMLATVGAGLLYLVDPRVPGNYPPCLFLYFTGCYCPGCGTLRALHRLLHGDLIGALGYNPLTMLVLPLITVTGVAGLTEAVGRPLPFNFTLSHRVAWAVVVVIILFWTLRNVPIYPLTTLAP